MDRNLYEDINGYVAGHSTHAHLAEFLAVDAIYLLVVVLALLAVSPPRWTGAQGRPAFLSAGLSAALALGLAQVVSHLIARPRPFVAQPNHSQVLVDSARDFTFPSDHATAGFAIGTAITLRMPRVGAPLLVLVTCICVSRVAVGVHYPGDVLAGAALGAACAGLIWLPPIRSRIDEFSGAASRTFTTRLARLGLRS